jgi:cyclase
MKKIFRIISKLDIKNSNLIKGINLEGLRVLGNPNEFAKEYYNQGVDEICYLDNIATLYGTTIVKKFISNAVKEIFLPIAVGGGLRTIEDIRNVFASGADKACINSAAIDKKNFLNEASKIFGSSNITSIIEVVKIDSSYYLSKANGRDLSYINPFDWVKIVEDQGAGEILLISVNAEGLQSGFDLKFVEKFKRKTNLPILVNGGAGCFEHILDLAKKTNVDGVVIASLFHYNTFHKFNIKEVKLGNIEFIKKNIDLKKSKINIIRELKLFLKKNKINVRF